MTPAGWICLMLVVDLMCVACVCVYVDSRLVLSHNVHRPVHARIQG